MDLRSLNTFIQVAELSSFTRAAERLGYAQPTISVQIKQLEQELGIKLFERIGHTIRLTEKGRDVLGYAQRICHMCEEMALESEQQSEARGEIRLGMGDSLCASLMNRGFARFRERYPNISIRVRIGGTDELFSMLDHNEVDMVCTLDSHVYNTNYVIANEEKIGVHFVIASDHPLAKAETLELRDLLDQPFLLTEKGMSYRHILEERLARDSIEIKPVLETSSANLICDLVEQGMGVAFLPDYVTQPAVERGTVTRLSIPNFEPELWKQFLYHRDKWVSRPMQAAIAHFSEILLEQNTY